ncbi:MAG: hypothetical protein AAB710_02565 [Patescibacteria group bacterium]
MASTAPNVSRIFIARWQLIIILGMLGSFLYVHGWFHWYETPIGSIAWCIYTVTGYAIGYNALRLISWVQGPWAFHYTGFLFAHFFIFLLSGWKSSGTYTWGWWLDSFGHGQFFFVTALMFLYLFMPYIRSIRALPLRIMSYIGLILACLGLGSIWELIEYKYDIDFGRYIHLLAQEDNDDTMGDMIANGLGVVLAMSCRGLYGLRWRRKHPSESAQDDEDTDRIRDLMSEIYAHWEEIRGIIETMRKRHREQNPTRTVWVNMLRELHERTGRILENLNRE